MYRSGVDFTKSRKCDFQAFDGLKFTLTTDLRLTIFCEINHWPPFYDFIKLAAGILMHLFKDLRVMHSSFMSHDMFRMRCMLWWVI